MVVERGPIRVSYKVVFFCQGSLPSTKTTGIKGQTKCLCFYFVGNLLQLNGTKLYDKIIRVEPAKSPGGGRSGRVNIPSMLPSSYVMPIPQLANYGYGGNPNRNPRARRNNRRQPQGPSDIVKIPEDKILLLVDVGVNLPNKV